LLVFYNIFLILYRVGINITSLWNAKARFWVEGRKNMFQRLKAAEEKGQGPIIWMHSSSLGEFEQGRPVLESLKTAYPNHRILLTFFSPSGYEVRKNYDGADMVFYLPLDGCIRSRKFLDIVSPELANFHQIRILVLLPQWAKKKRDSHPADIRNLYSKTEFFWALGRFSKNLTRKLYSSVCPGCSISSNPAKIQAPGARYSCW